MDTVLLRLVIFVVMFLVFLIPLALILLANLGERYSSARVLTIVSAVLLCVLLLACGPMTALAAFMPASGQGAPPGLALPSPWLALFSGVVYLGTGVLALLPLIPQVRAALAYVIPLRPESIVNGLALSLAIMLVGVSVASLPTAFAVANPDPQTESLLENINTLPLLWLQGLMFAVYGLTSVGLFLRRNWRATLQRLGLTRLTWAGFSVAIAAWLGLFLFDMFVTLIWRTISPQAFQDFGQVTDALFGAFVSLPGAATIGLSAGIGEEILFRGALQPRLGIPLTAFLFMIVHAQYGFTPALLQILVVGVVLGLVRKHVNTTATIIIHTLFNATSVLMALYFPNFQ